MDDDDQNELNPVRQTANDDPIQGKAWKPRCSYKVVFIALALVVQTTLLVKGPLFITRNVLTHKICTNSTATNNNNTGHYYIITMVIYSLLFLGRFVEFLVVEINFYQFLFTVLPKLNNVSKSLYAQFCKSRTQFRIRLLLIGAGVYLFLTLQVIPVIGIVLEINHARKFNCDEYKHEPYIIYWILDIIRYFADIFIRLLMITATFLIGKVWFDTEDKYSITKHEHSSELITLSYRRDQQDLTNDENANEHGSELETLSPFEEYLQDLTETSDDHMKRSQEYNEKGKIVRAIAEIFQSWFIIQWVLFFISSFLETDHILNSWSAGSTESDKGFSLSEMNYLFYNYNQIVLLSISFFCGKKMNAYHAKYRRKIRKEQLCKFHANASRLAFARTQHIEKDEHFDFVPRIWGTNIKVEVSNLLYVIFLLVGIFFTVANDLVLS